MNYIEVNTCCENYLKLFWYRGVCNNFLHVNSMQMQPGFADFCNGLCWRELEQNIRKLGLWHTVVVAFNSRNIKKQLLSIFIPRIVPVFNFKMQFFYISQNVCIDENLHVKNKNEVFNYYRMVNLINALFETRRLNMIFKFFCSNGLIWERPINNVSVL